MMDDEQWINAGCPFGPHCETCGGPCRALAPAPRIEPIVSIEQALRNEFARGLSRGLELAKECAAGSHIDWSAADEAVAKEGK